MVCSSLTSYQGSSPFYHPLFRLVYSFLVINSTPKVISHTIAMATSYFRKSLPIGIKKLPYHITNYSRVQLSSTWQKLRRQSYLSLCGIWTVFQPVIMQGSPYLRIFNLHTILIFSACASRF